MLFHHWAHWFANDTDSNFTPNGYRIEPLLIAIAWFFALVVGVFFLDPVALRATVMAVIAISPVVLPVMFLVTFWELWIDYIRFQFWLKQKYVLLEITLPPEVQKSPLSMELFLTALWNNGSETTFIQRIWKGQYRAIWTLEMVSNEGKIGFYLHLPDAWRNNVESRLYGQFPEAQVRIVGEGEDYVSTLNFNLDEYFLWGTEYAKSGPGALPIKTYIDYQLDKNPDTPEIQVDPLSNVLEFLSSIGPGEYVWLQIVMKARKKDEWYGFYKKKDEFMEGGKEAIQKLVQGAAKRSKELVASLNIEDKEGIALKQAASRGAALLSEGERRRVEGIERSMGKLLFECGIRALYICKKDHFHLVNINSLVRLFDPFRSNDFNKINVTRGMSIFDYPWQDFREIRKRKLQNNLFHQYKHRAYFYVPYDQVPVYLTTEELATLWHFPNSIVQPPGLDRVSSKRAEAPVNLPTLPA